MKILDRYIILSFIWPFIYALLAFTSILILTEWLGMIDLLVRTETPTLITLEYLGLRIPSILVTITPCAILLAIIFAFNELISHGEITAIQVSGVGVIRISLPVLILAFGMSITSFVWTESIGTEFNARAYQTKRRKIEDVSPKTKMYGVSLLGQGNRVYHFGVFDREIGEIRDVTITESKGGISPVLRIDAQYAQWHGGEWRLYNGFIRRFDETGEKGTPEVFKIRSGQIRETPDEIWSVLHSKKKRSEDMTIFELKDYISLLERSGGKFRAKLTDFYLKFSLPLANFIIAFVGVSLVFSLSHKEARRGKMAGFGIALIVIFLYWGTTAIGQSLGHAEVLSPLLSAWIANILFLGLGIVLWCRYLWRR